MNSTSVLLALAALLVVCVGSFAQYPPPPGPYNERCRWQCDPYRCNYYYDYCDYDCYEVCYGPYRNQQQSTASEGLLLSQQQATKSSPNGATELGAGGAQQQQQQDNNEVRTGKSIKMRIDNPVYQNGRSSSAVRASVPRGFAVTQNCLSNQVPANQVFSS